MVFHSFVIAQGICQLDSIQQLFTDMLHWAGFEMVGPVSKWWGQFGNAGLKMPVSKWPCWFRNGHTGFDATFKMYAGFGGFVGQVC